MVQISGEHAQKLIGINRYLNDVVTHKDVVLEELRVCESRIARTIYTLRCRQSIVRKSDVDANKVDLEFTHYAAAWIVLK